jgi:hypothetical protein
MVLAETNRRNAQNIVGQGCDHLQFNSAGSQTIGMVREKTGNVNRGQTVKSQVCFLIVLKDWFMKSTFSFSQSPSALYWAWASGLLPSASSINTISKRETLGLAEC